MKREGGVSIIPCKVNGLGLNFIFDTGASDVSISLTEASFMLKNGYLDASDIIGTSNYLDANGNISEGVKINLREIEISGLKMFNVKATIVKNIKAPLLLGQSAISKLGKFQLDLDSNTLTILTGKDVNHNSNRSENKKEVPDTTKEPDIIPKTENENFEQGNLKFEKGDYQGAIEDYDMVIEINPTRIAAFQNRAASKKILKDFVGAINDYTKVLKINPKSYEDYCWRGGAKSELKDYKGAIADLNKSIEIEPKYDIAYYNRGYIKSEIKDYRGAIADYNKAIQLNSKDPDVFNNRGHIKEKLKDYRGAIADYDKAIKLDSSYFFAYRNRGISKMELKDYRGAIEDYNIAIEINPEDAGTYYHRGLVKDKLQDYEGAIADYNKAIEINPKDIFSALQIEFSKAALKEQQKEKEWVFISSSIDGDKHFIKSSYLTKDKSIIRIWTKTESKKTSLYINGKTLNYINVKILLLSEFHCSNKMSKYVSIIYYDSKGHIISQSDEETDWRNVIPETIGESMLNKVCELFN